MKATLVFPGLSCGWGAFGKQDMSTEANFISYGLAYVAAYAKSHGHQIDLLDLRRLSGWDAFDEYVINKGPGVFAFSSMSVDYGTAAEGMRRIKKTDSRSIIVLGGVHATVATKEVVNNPDIDHIIVGEGEISFSALLDQIDNGDIPERIIRGISPDINELPYPDRDLFEYRKGEMTVPWLSHMPAPFVSIISSRGCPYQCTFCQPAERMVFGGKARMRTVKSVISELEYLREKYDFKSLLIHDDLFTFDHRWIEHFCDAYQNKGFSQMFTCQARSDFIVRYPDVVKRMKDVGLSCFMIGFESGSQRILDFIKKKTTVEKNREAVRLCKSMGIKIFANYMFGLPTETPEEVFRTIDFIRWAKPDYPSPAFFTPHPGSELYDYCQTNNLNLIKSYASYRRNPTEPKIKGPDYEFLKAAVQLSIHHSIDQQIDYFSDLPAENEQLELIKKNLIQAKQKLSQLESHYRELYAVRPYGKDESNSGKSIKSDTKRVLVTGGTGFIGAALTRKLISKGHSVTVMTRNSNHPQARQFASQGIQIVQGNVENREAMERLNGFDVIYHLAVFPGIDGPEMYAVNVGGTENMLRAAKRNKVEKFIYASSIEAQGTTESIHQPLDEHCLCRPVSPYGESKLAGEALVLDQNRMHGLCGVVARIGNVYGPGGPSFIYPMASAIIERNILLQALSVYASRMVQPIYIDDLTSALVTLLDKDQDLAGVYNFTGHQPVSIAKWFETLADLLGLQNHVQWALASPSFSENQVDELRHAHPQINYFLSGSAPRIHRFYTDNKLAGIIGDYQKYSLSKGVAFALQWHHRVGLFSRYLPN